MPKNIFKYYWWCQIVGWIFWALFWVLLTFTFDQGLSPKLFQRLAVMVISGIIVTHLFRLVIRKFNWLLLPVEKVLPKLIIGIVFVCVIDGLIRIGAISVFNLTTSRSKLDFPNRLLIYTLEK